MGLDEVLAWQEFARQFPFDDLHRFHRPAAFIGTQNAAPEKRNAAVIASLDWLQPEPTLQGLPDADTAIIRLMGFNRKG